MKTQSIDFYYFSGTGNTLLAVETFSEVISKKGFSVRILRLEKSDPRQINQDHIIGIAFPVAMSTYPFVWDFVHALPKVSSTRIFILATMAGGSIGLIGRMKNVLSGKGYVPLGAHQVKMPLNVFYVFSEEKSKAIREKGLDSVRIYAGRIAEGRAKWPVIPFLSDAAYFIYRIVIGTWKVTWHQKVFRHRLNSSLCSKCGFCAMICPTQNIHLEPFPVFGLDCQYCMRCLSYCPKGAIRSRFLFKNRAYKATPCPYGPIQEALNGGHSVNKPAG
ncbi:MAG: EFR1 family ferrodoxin [Candidatus Wallbacteria bacterium]|nr:EFR1 family ferrodoxin [Candidatus Wallbacteria bacterium]